MEPQKFGRYEIRGEIGRGGMATVYHAYDPRFDREVALKVLPHEMLHDLQFRARFEREAKTIAMLEHPAIVPVYDFGEEDGQPYFVMRYMTGGSLSDRMKNGLMSLEEAARIFDHLAPALDESHAKGIIHRDLKPGNILFDQYGEPYISDFGIAKIAASQTNVTGSAIVGTPAYMSPEQAQGEGIDGRSDIYGLGVIIFELLSGQQPYHGDTPMSVVVKHITDPVPHILDVKPDLPPAVESIIEKAMAKDRNQRFPTVKALAQALNAVARGETPNLEITDQTMVASPKTVLSKSPVSGAKTVLAQRGQLPEPDPAAPRKKSGLWIGLGGAAVLVCVAAVAGIILFKDKIPFLSAPTASMPPILRVTDTVEVRQPTSTDTPGIIIQPPVASDTPASIPTETPTLTPNPTATVRGLPSIGGADLIAFLNNNDIWVMGVEGSNLTQITKDGAAKKNLQWSPDGQSLFYISGKCIQAVPLQNGTPKMVTCFNSAERIDAFSISRDGKRVAISVNRVLYIVPFDLTAISAATNWAQLLAMPGVLRYGPPGLPPPSKDVRWSSDGKKLAVNINSSEPGYDDMISLLDISGGSSVEPNVLDFIPGIHFKMSNYSMYKTIPYFDWDGNALFVLNSQFRYEMGYLYEYNREIYKGINLDPLNGACCYAAARFSPDGTYLVFAYQNIQSSNVKTELYYIPYGSIGTGASYTRVPLPLPDTFFSNMKNHLDAALRPAIP
jgi:serine/threonine protein kinase